MLQENQYNLSFINYNFQIQLCKTLVYFICPLCSYNSPQYKLNSQVNIHRAL